jgi:hypothetical protein
MNFTAEQIQENWATFILNIESYISSPRKEQLLNFYYKNQDRLILMPASAKKEYHNAFPGGYIDHINRVVRCALGQHDLWVEMGVDDTTYTIEELVFAAINHDLGKLGDEENNCYIPQTDNWRKEKLGEDYTFNTKMEFMSVPDRSIYTLISNNIPFTKNEMLAIKLHDGLYDDANKPYLINWLPEQKPRTALIFILHQADLMASRIEFERVWLPQLKNGKNSLEVKTGNFTLKNKTTSQSKVKTKALGTIKSEGLKNMLDNL